MTAVNTFGANGLVSRTLPTSGTTFYAFDERGNMARRVNSSGTVLNSDLYDAFGKQHSGASDVFGFGSRAGYYTDTETGLVLCTNRHYDPQSGRFLSRDLVGYDGGINLYSYTANNPINRLDPSGHGGAEDDEELETLEDTPENNPNWEREHYGDPAAFYRDQAIDDQLNELTHPLSAETEKEIEDRYKERYPDRYNGPKPDYDNPGTHDTQGGSFRGGGSRTTPLPDDAEEVYLDRAIPDNEGKNWYGRGKDGDIYRYQPGRNGNHWNGREYSPRGITVPSECRARLGQTPKPPRGLR